jgi:hypothetical protein
MENFRTFGGAVLSADMTNVATTANVASVDNLPEANFRVMIGSEIMLVTAVVGTALTVTRAQEGTTGAAHTSGAEVIHVLTAGALAAMTQTDLVVRDTFANRPSAGVAGRIFLPTDDCNIYFDTGGVWVGKGPMFNCTPATTSTHASTLNAASELVISDIDEMLTMEVAAGTTGKAYGKYKAYPGDPFTVTAMIAVSGNAAETPCGAIGVLNSSTWTGALLEVTINEGGMTIQASTWTGINNGGTRTARTTIGDSGLLYHFSNPVLVRLRRVGAALFFGYSLDNVNWHEPFSVVTTDYNSIFVGTVGRTSAATFNVAFPHWSEV